MGTGAVSPARPPRGGCQHHRDWRPPCHREHTGRAVPPRRQAGPENCVRMAVWRLRDGL